MQRKYFNHYSLAAAALFAVALVTTGPLQALGTYSEGKVLVLKLKKFESGGLMFESWEGEAIVTGYDTSEEGKGKGKCQTKEYTCFTSKPTILKFSVRPENAKTVNFLRKHKDQGGFLLAFRQHRIEPMALSTDFEIEKIVERTAGMPAKVKAKTVAKKTGSRHFALKGHIHRFEYRGTFIGTYEGIYKDVKTGKVHPFSVTNENMAKVVAEAMTTTDAIYLGVSVAIVTGFRGSDHDIFEVNFKEQAGGVEDPATKKQ